MYTETSLFESIKVSLGSTDVELLAKRLGYRDITKLQNRIEHLKNSETLFKFIQVGGYDLVCTVEDFIERLCKAFGLSDYEGVLDEINNKLTEIAKIEKSPYIYIDTGFKRSTQPIHVLAAMEPRRRISIDKKDLVGKSSNEILGSISSLIKSHYTQTNGKIEMWGEIERYIFNHIDGGRYEFDIKGNLITSSSDAPESYATLKI